MEYANTDVKDKWYTFSGSFGSSGGGVRLVFTAQKLHPRVHVSPIIIIVAVAVPFGPPQHSPILGHLASSQTVASPNSLTVFLSVWNPSPPAGCALSQGGLRWITTPWEKEIVFRSRSSVYTTHQSGAHKQTHIYIYAEKLGEGYC